MDALRHTLDPARIVEALRRIERPRDERLQRGFDVLSTALDAAAAPGSDPARESVNAWGAAELQRIAGACVGGRRWTLVDAYESAGEQYVVVCCGAAPSAEALEWSTLSDREREVAVAAARGSSNKQIAFELGLAHSTVRVLCHRAMQKLKVATREALIAKVRALGLP
jgi:DNA-binding CsgD family transcriptional regulator